MPTNELQSIISRNTSYADVLIDLGFSPNSGSMKTMLRKRIEQDNINISSIKFKANQHERFELKDILIENSEYTSRYRLKIRLVNAGLLVYKCNKCLNEGHWNGKKLTLQLEHKNGKTTDNRIENLEFLCPNCHSQTDTYAGGNKKME